MTLDPATVTEQSQEYEREEPLFLVERDRIETLPEAFRDGTVVWKDAEWIVRWYYRRYLGTFPTNERQRVEDAFRENDWDRVQTAVDTALDAPTVTEKVTALTALEGVDAAVASAFLLYLDPDAYVPVDDRAWRTLVAAGHLEDDPPERMTPAAYERYLERCRGVARELDVDLLTLYRALWRLGGDPEGADGGQDSNVSVDER